MKTMLLATVVLAGLAGTGVAWDGEYCREYSKTVTINGKTQRAYGTACMQPDGSWKTQDGDDLDEVMAFDAPPAPGFVDFDDDEFVNLPPQRYVERREYVYSEPATTYSSYWSTGPQLSFSYGNDDWGRGPHHGHHGRKWERWERHDWEHWKRK